LSNTNAAGEWAVVSLPRIEYDWFYQSLCSAHLEEAHQWGAGIGFEDDLFVTNEEWHSYQDEKTFVGNTYHALDLKTSTMYAMGATSFGGFEKSAEINPQHKNYVMLAMSGTAFLLLFVAVCCCTCNLLIIIILPFRLIHISLSPLSNRLQRRLQRH
jgi:hypothetical protein